MKSLAERHEDRAKRISDNRSEREGATVNTAAAAIVAAQNAADLMAGLGEDAKQEFETAMAGYDPTSSHSLAEDDNGETMAGIGVINTKVVPASAEGGNGGGAVPGWSTPPPTPDLGGSNIAGASLEAQAGESAPKRAQAKPAKSEEPD